MSETVNDRLLNLMVSRIELLNTIGIALSSENDPIRLQERILHGAKAITSADAGTLYRLDPVRRHLTFEIMHTDSLGISRGGTTGLPIDLPPVPLERDGHRPNHGSVVAHAVLSGATINLPDVSTATGFDFSGTRAFDERTGYRTQSVLTVPMRDHEHQIIGVLQLLNAHAGDGVTVIPFSALAQRMAESLASQAAIALSRTGLIAGLENLFEGFVKLIAGAIDEKSPYTGGHCRRVCDLTLRLAEAVVAHPVGDLQGFTMSEADRYELYLAALLHDCGKITTPEWVMDKSTKLQTVHDRVHEVETRFAVLRQEAELRRLRALADGGDPTSVETFHRAELEALVDDLEFLRRINQGRVPMSTAEQARIRQLAARRWTDHAGQAQPLLSADEIEHLCVVRGNLTEDERAIINHHSLATIAMLESLPLPRHLLHLPEYAGAHHERCDGRGYPRGLRREEMPVQARIMAVADVFEALTAGDRPYKKALPLSQTLTLLDRMSREGHLDPDIVRVFLDQGLWRAYAREHLRPEQIDVATGQFQNRTSP